MKAVIVSAEKQTLPQFNTATNQDEPTLVVVTEVNFLNDDGTLHSTQSYAQRPSEIDLDNPQAYFDRQAVVLQNDLDGREANVESQATSELADQIVEKLNPVTPEETKTADPQTAPSEESVSPAGDPAPAEEIENPTDNEPQED